MAPRETKPNAVVEALSNAPAEQAAQLADAIRSTADAAAKLLAGGLNERALLLLIQAAAERRGHKVSLANIRAVLHAASSLSGEYLAPKGRKP